MKDKLNQTQTARVESGSENETGAISRRIFLQGVSLAAGAAAVPFSIRSAEAESGSTVLGPGPVQVEIEINGEVKKFQAEPRETLLDVLRNRLDLTGSKQVCDRGSCGCCTVMIAGESVNACMMLALDARGKKITTIEGLAASDGALDPIQEAFIEHDALQCGFCTPGLIMRSRAFLNGNPHPTLAEIKRGLAGNLCRCGTYPHVFSAIQMAARKGA